jgi:excisionase family DNA binding protein
MGTPMEETLPKRVGTIARQHHGLPLPEIRGLSLEQAADYIGVGKTKFLDMVQDRRMPKPKRMDGRVVWDRAKLDEAFAALPDDEAEHQPKQNEWDGWIDPKRSTRRES